MDDNNRRVVVIDDGRLTREDIRLLREQAASFEIVVASNSFDSVSANIPVFELWRPLDYEVIATAVPLDRVLHRPPAPLRAARPILRTMATPRGRRPLRARPGGAARRVTLR